MLYLRSDHHQLHWSWYLVLSAHLTLVPASITHLHTTDAQRHQVRDLGPGVQRAEPPVADEGLPVHGEDVSVPLPQPGDALVAEVVDLALQERCPPLLSCEHQV